MATSSNPKIQKLMDEVEAIELNDTDLEMKLNIIARKVATEQRKAKITGLPYDEEEVLTDPSEALACEGCQ